MPTQPLSAEGAVVSWSGRLFGSGTCGPSATQCTTQSCAAPGWYTAVMCAYAADPPDGDSPACSDPATGSTETCVEVPFQYPSDGTVVVGRLSESP